ACGGPLPQQPLRARRALPRDRPSPPAAPPPQAHRPSDHRRRDLRQGPPQPPVPGALRQPAPTARVHTAGAGASGEGTPPGDRAAVLAALGWPTAQRNTLEAESRLSAARSPTPERHPSHDTPGKTMNPLLQVRQHGQQIWLDNLSRTLLEEGHLARFVADDGVAGVTTNPAIFHKAISGGRYYEDDLATLKQQPLSAEARYEALVIPDVQRACDLLAPLHRDSGGSAGYVSLEVS